jgi:T5SS/PEP-CTERM-associated repeat protein
MRPVGRLLVSGGAVTTWHLLYRQRARKAALDGRDVRELMVSNALWLGQNAGAVGDARLSGGELIVANAVTVGNNGVGALSVSNGAMTVMSDFTVGLNATGSLEVAGGACSVAGNGMLRARTEGRGGMWG